jgi:hypothetical protein
MTNLKALCLFRFKAFSLLVALFLSFSLIGCGGGGDSGGSSSDVSIAATYSKFPSFDESSLTIVAKEALKVYNSLSNTQISSFLNSLVSNKGFALGTIQYCTNAYYKTDAIDSMNACAYSVDDELITFIDGDSNSRMPNDADFNDVFGSVPGTLFVVQRAIRVINNQAAQNKISSYIATIQNNGFNFDENNRYYKKIGTLNYYIYIWNDQNYITATWTITKSSDGNGNNNDNEDGGSSGLCGDISYEGVKKTTNFPLYDLSTNTFPREQVFNYHPIPNISTYDTLLKGNGFTSYQSNAYVHYSGDLIDIGVVMIKNSDDGSFTAAINYRSNLSLLSAITPAEVPLKQYQLLEHYTGERAFVINHIAQYKNSLKGLGFKEISGDNYGLMEKEVGNCVYRWFYQHVDHYLNAANGYINYNWVIVDKTFDNLE